MDIYYKKLAIARIKYQIRMFGFIDYGIAKEICREIFKPLRCYGHLNKQIYEVLNTFTRYYFYICNLCLYKYFNRGDLIVHLKEKHLKPFPSFTNIYTTKTILIFFWETDKPFSPSKIKPNWWEIENELSL